MEYLRWILLVIGIVFVAVVYFMGRRRRRNNNSVDTIERDNDLPELSAHDWEQLDEGVGHVRVVTQFDDDEEQEAHSVFQSESHLQNSTPAADQASRKSSVTSASKSTDKTATQSKVRPDDLVTLYLMAKDEPLSGDMINSAAYANGLVFGKMQIFHRLDDNEEPIYSMANMMEPGYFDAETIHSLKTRGLVLFIQFEQLKYPSEALHDLLRCAYRMADMIGARLCNHKRQPLTEKDAIAYRQLAAVFDAES